MAAKRHISLGERLTEILVGAFFFLALIILALFTIVIKGDTLLSQSYTRHVDFENIGSVKAGDKVLVRGMEVGQVDGMDLTEDAAGVRIKVKLMRDLQFFQNYDIEIRNSSVLGGWFLYVELGEPGSGPVAGDAILEGRPPVDIFGEAGELLHSLREDERRLRQALVDSDLLQKVEFIINDMQSFTAHVRDGEGFLGRLIYDVATYDSLQRSMAAFEDAGAKANSAIERLQAAGETIQSAGVSVKTAADGVTTAAGNLNEAITKARAGKGTIGRLLTDESLYDEVKTTVTELREFARRFSSGDSTIGRLAGDDGEFYTSLTATFQAWQQIAEKINAGEGTLGLLVTDPTLFNDAREMVNRVRDAVDDIRETLPIGTAGSMLLNGL